jgi:glycosyltransferase involved in cell wall biosynthesis
MYHAIVTVVMPCFNAAATVEASIRSVQAQTRSDWQLIVVDDGSQDNTVDMIEAMGDARIRLICQANAGVSAARNRALSEVSTPYVAFLDADDTWAPEFIQVMLDALIADAEAGIAYCGWQDVHAPTRKTRAHDPPDYEAAGQHKFALLLQRCPWVIHAAVSRTEAVRAACGFDPRFAIAEDFLLWLRVAARQRVVKAPGCMAFYHHDDRRPQATRDVVRVVRQTRYALRVFLDEQPQIKRQLGRRACRELLFSPSLRSAFDALWSRQLFAAQRLLRDCLFGGYFSREDLKYMLPALLPAKAFAWLVRGRDAAARAET